MLEKTEGGLPLDADIDELVDEYLARKQAGEDISVEQFAEIYSDRKEEILSLLPVVDYLEASDPKINPQLMTTDHLPSVLLGDYSISRLIGFGGMGTVYEAEHFLRSQVALKVMVSKNVADGRRFEREAKILAGLHHPNIVPVFDFGVTDSVNYMSMKFVDGPNLSQVMAARDDDSSTCGKAKKIANCLDNDWSMLARIGYQVAGALDYAHSHGVLHRDIKPANLLIEDDENVWVTDFGLAKLNYEASNLTQTGNAVGTLQYMAPEQLENVADVRTDVYSLGITLYELALRKQKSSSTIYTRHPLKKPSQFSPSIPKGLESIILKASQPDPADRFQTAADFAAELAKYCGHRKPTVSTSNEHPVWNVRNAVSLIAMLILAALVVLKARTIQPPKTIFEHTFSKSFKDKNTAVVFDPTTNVTTMVTRVTSSTDDAEEWNGSNEYPHGRVYWKSSDLELTWDEGGQFIGIRFSDVVLPKDANIRNAFIQFTCDYTDVGPTNLKIHGDTSKISESFKRKKYNISKRPRTDACVEWNDIPAWQEWEASEDQQTPNLAAIINEVIDQPFWQSNSPLTFIISGTGKRSATSFDYDPIHAPKLVIEYESKSTTEAFASK